MITREMAIATARRCAEALAGNLSPDDRDGLLDMHREALKALEQFDNRHRPTTEKRMARIGALERDTQVCGMDAGERARYIQSRMGLSRSGYYKLRKLLRESTKLVD